MKKKQKKKKQLLIDSIKEQMQVGETAYEFEHQQSVVLVIGVNGVGKTTSVGKLAGNLEGTGQKRSCWQQRIRSVQQQWNSLRNGHTRPA